MRNLLSEWFVTAQRHTAVIDEPVISDIHDTLLKYFGVDYFIVEPNYDPQLKDLSWIWTLLSNVDNVSCMHALYDIAQLTKYLHTIDPDIIREFHELKGNAENLRAFYFELFVFRMMDNSGIPNQKKIVIDQQPLDATCTIDGQLFLVECKKNFQPDVGDWDVIRRLTIDFMKASRRFSVGEGVICSIRLARPITGKQYHVFQQLIRECSSRWKVAPDFLITPVKVTIPEGTIALDPFNEQLLKALEAESPDVLCHTQKQGDFVEGKGQLYEVGVGFMKSVYNDELYKSLERSLERKHRQHKRSSIEQKIFIFDSETIPELHMNLFQSEDMLEVEKAKQVYEKLRMKEIVCLVERRYNETRPFIRGIVLTPPALKKFGETLIGIIEHAYDYPKL